MLVGGCTGSTAGGQNVSDSRAAQRAPRASAPTDLSARTFVIAYNGTPVTSSVRAGVTLYFFVYLSTFMLFALALAFCGMSFEASIEGSAAALGGGARRNRSGARVGDRPCCTFAPLPDAVKWLLIVEMLAGRLEILILIIPLTRTFWRT